MSDTKRNGSDAEPEPTFDAQAEFHLNFARDMAKELAGRVTDLEELVERLVDANRQLREHVDYLEAKVEQTEPDPFEDAFDNRGVHGVVDERARRVTELALSKARDAKSQTGSVTAKEARGALRPPNRAAVYEAFERAEELYADSVGKTPDEVGRDDPLYYARGKNGGPSARLVVDLNNLGDGEKPSEVLK